MASRQNILPRARTRAHTVMFKWRRLQILKARAMALENAKHERAAAASENRLLAELDRHWPERRAAGGKAPAEKYVPAQRLAA